MIKHPADTYSLPFEQSEGRVKYAAPLCSDQMDIRQNENYVSSFVCLFVWSKTDKKHYL